MNKKEIRLMATLISVVMLINGFSIFYQPRLDVDFKQPFKKASQAQTPSVPDSFFYASSNWVEEKTVASIPEELQLELLGTALGNVKDPIAFIKDLTTGKQKIYRKGRSVRGFVLAKISMGEVTFERDNQRQILRLSDRAMAWSNIEPDNTPIIATQGTQIVVNKQGALRQVAKIYRTLREVKVKPYYNSNEIVGMRVEGVSPGSIVEQAGIRNNDIIQVVNNQRIDSYQKALEVFNKARKNSEVKVCLLRDGQSKVLCYRIDE